MTGSPGRARQVRCPTCGKVVEWRPENAFRPFCGERCRLIDLGDWAAGSYRLPAESPDFPETPPTADADD